MPSKAPPEMHAVMHDNTGAFMVHHCLEGTKFRVSIIGDSTVCRHLGRGERCGSFRKQCASVVYQALQPMGRDV